MNSQNDVKVCVYACAHVWCVRKFWCVCSLWYFNHGPNIKCTITFCSPDTRAATHTTQTNAHRGGLTPHGWPGVKIQIHTCVQHMLPYDTGISLYIVFLICDCFCPFFYIFFVNLARPKWSMVPWPASPNFIAIFYESNAKGTNFRIMVVCFMFM